MDKNLIHSWKNKQRCLAHFCLRSYTMIVVICNFYCSVDSILFSKYSPSFLNLNFSDILNRIANLWTRLVTLKLHIRYVLLTIQVKSDVLSAVLLGNTMKMQNETFFKNLGIIIIQLANLRSMARLFKRVLSHPYHASYPILSRR